MTRAPDPHLEQVLKSAKEELRGLLERRAEIMQRIGTIRQTVKGLITIFGAEILTEDLLALLEPKGKGPQSGLTEACRSVLMEANVPLNARQICEHIQATLPALSKHKDPVASVTTILNRLVEYGEAKTMINGNGRRTWQWRAGEEQFCLKNASALPTLNRQ